MLQIVEYRIELTILRCKISCATNWAKGLVVLMAFLIYTYAFCTFVSMNSRLCKLLKIKSVILKDKALFQANPVSIDAGTAELSAGQYCR